MIKRGDAVYRELSDKVAIVTGGSSGIGRGIVERLYNEGMRVVFTYQSNQSKAQKIIEGLDKERVKTIQTDVTKEADIQNLFEFTLRHFNEVNVLVNNAGVQSDVPSHEMEMDEFDRVMNTNLRAAFMTNREAIRHFLEQRYKGTIINISSVHEIIPWPHYTHYSASKGGLKLMTQSLALEYARLGIRINNIAPGSIDTPINAEFLKDEKAKEEAGNFVPMGFVGEVEHIAGIVAFLASKESIYITGQTIVADGGLSLYPSHRNMEHDYLKDEMRD